MPNLLPPYPTDRDWKAWATKLHSFLAENLGAQSLPKAVSLAHNIGANQLSAVTDGVILYSPELGEPIVSIGGEWYGISATNKCHLYYQEATGDGDALVNGTNQVDLNTAGVSANWAVLAGGVVALNAGTYRISGSLQVASSAASPEQTAVGYLALSTVLGTPLGDTLSNPAVLPAAIAVGQPVTVAISGEFTLASDTIAALVLNVDGANLRIGTEHGIAGIPNRYADLQIQRIK